MHAAGEQTEGTRILCALAQRPAGVAHDPGGLQWRDTGSVEGQVRKKRRETAFVREDICRTAWSSGRKG